MINCPFDVTHEILGKGRALNFVKRGNEIFVRILFGKSPAKEFSVLQFLKNLHADDKKIQDEIVSRKQNIEWTSPLVLTEGRILYKTGRETYNMCSDYFGWDIGSAGAFNPQGIMYAQKVTPERYSVWMIVHNSLVEPSYNGVSSWYNVVKGDTLEEIWFTDERGSAKVTDISIRVTFLKTRDGYMFKGVYKLSDAELREINGQRRIVKIYKMISNKYPTRPEWM